MTDHPVYLQGAGAVVGGTVSLPDGPPRAALLIAPGGNSNRVGRNQVFTRLAHRLAQSGIASLRFELPGHGYAVTPNRLAMRDFVAAEPELTARVEAWFRTAVPCNARLLFGLCQGGLAMLHVSARLTQPLPALVVGAFLYGPEGIDWETESPAGRHMALEHVSRRSVVRRFGRRLPNWLLSTTREFRVRHRRQRRGQRHRDGRPFTDPRVPNLLAVLDAADVTLAAADGSPEYASAERVLGDAAMSSDRRERLRLVASPLDLHRLPTREAQDGLEDLVVRWVEESLGALREGPARDGRARGG